MTIRNVGKASILAVGTELTTGQITNRNAPWIANQLVQLGIEVVLHETVPDDRQLILEALDRCNAASQLVFVTGGLGPTTDDFTRDVVAHWLNQPLEYSQSTWDLIVDRLSRYGIPVAESNRQQCFFPKGAQILFNSEGTAAGFYCIRDQSQEQDLDQRTHLWVFPGPPNEVKAVWNNGVESILLKIIPHFEPLELFTWQCMGKSEAELGEITELALQGSGLITGYRAHRPFIEIKVWCPRSRVEEKRNWLDQLEKQIQPWMITKQGEDLAHRLLTCCQNLSARALHIIDDASQGKLSQRMSNLLRLPSFESLGKRTTLQTTFGKFQSLKSVEEFFKQNSDSGRSEELTLIVSGFTPQGAGVLGMKLRGTVRIEVFQTPYEHPDLIQRMQPYASEIALLTWERWLNCAPGTSPKAV